MMDSSWTNQSSSLSLDLSVGPLRSPDHAPVGVIEAKLNQISKENKRLAEMVSDMHMNYSALRGRLFDLASIPPQEKGSVSPKRKRVDGVSCKYQIKHGEDPMPKTSKMYVRIDPDRFEFGGEGWVSMEEIWSEGHRGQPLPSSLLQMLLCSFLSRQEEGSKERFGSQCSSSTPVSIDRCRTHLATLRSRRGRNAKAAETAGGADGLGVDQDQAWRRPHAQDLQDVRPNRPDRFEFGEHNHDRPSRDDVYSVSDHSAAAVLPCPSIDVEHTSQPYDLDEVEMPKLQRLLVEQMASALTKDPSFTAAIATAIYDRMLGSPPA
ncbi:hypothetical protein C4D60_Mb07t13050 [Musa balbisiana]|uniref:Uncharacterized protein n=1 Tax=Musa balbisiana TaxID=52838 RepID=A0A4V4H6L8_MUSBA|nr:hypothetical protein C4D60_Mb07t13050 [Musa balbisiana]